MKGDGMALASKQQSDDKRVVVHKIAKKKSLSGRNTRMSNDDILYVRTYNKALSSRALTGRVPDPDNRARE